MKKTRTRSIKGRPGVNKTTAKNQREVEDFVEKEGATVLIALLAGGGRAKASGRERSSGRDGCCRAEAETTIAGGTGIVLHGHGSGGACCRGTLQSGEMIDACDWLRAS